VVEGVVMPGGRPTQYDPSYCDLVVILGKEGKSIAQMASEIGVSKQTLHNWKDAHPEFLDAITCASTHSQAWWESKGQEHLFVPVGMGTFSGSVWSRSMAARFPDDWREKTETALTGANGGPVQIVATDHDEAL
jgi:transposase